jgi:glycosyltransferase involved in cell wall biosynthesis
VSGHEKRLLLVSFEALAIAGLQRMVLDLGRCLSDRGWTTRILFPSSSGERLLADWTAGAAPAEIVVTPAVKLSTEGRGGRDVVDLRREIARFHPTAVNLHYGVHYCSIKDIAAVLLTGRRPVVTIYAPYSISPGTLIDRSSNQIRSVRLAAPFVKKFVAISRNTAEGIAATGISASKIQTVLCGVQQPGLIDRAAARARLGIGAGTFVVSAVGGLVDYKGFVDVAAAVGRLNAEGQETLLLIAGSGPDEAAVTAAAGRLGEHCRLLGRVNETAPVFAASDLFVLPSRQEGFGLVYLEAAFQGVASIGCRSGGTPDAIDDGITGLLVPPGDVTALTDAIRALRSDPQRRAQMGAAARARATVGYTDEIMADSYDRILRQH